jgi:hypothetical protein
LLNQNRFTLSKDRMNYRANTILFLLLTIPTSLWAQTDDHGIWSSIGIEKKLKKWDIGAEYELRTKDNSQEIDRWSLKLEPSYHIFKFLQIGAGYEFICFHDTKYADYQPRHREYAFAQGKYKLGRFTFSIRERTQVTKKDDSDRIKKSGKINTYKINPEWTWRNRLKVMYNIPKLPISPSLSVETFYQLNNPDGNTFDKLRYTLSFQYRLTKHHQFEIYGLLDKEINVSNPVNTYIGGFGYVLSF